MIYISLFSFSNVGRFLCLRSKHLDLCINKLVILCTCFMVKSMPRQRSNLTLLIINNKFSHAKHNLHPNFLFVYLFSLILNIFFETIPKKYCQMCQFTLIFNVIVNQKTWKASNTIFHLLLSDKKPPLGTKSPLTQTLDF